MTNQLLTSENNPTIRLPDFIVPGMMKSGTTSLHFYLSQHPEIWMPEGKLQETHFFDYEENYNLGLPWYQDRLKGWTDEKLLGQTCPNYLHLAKVPERIYSLIPDAKFIIILRNPVDRAYSHYWHSVKKGREKKSFEKALELEEYRIHKDEWSMQNFSYLYRGQYADHLTAYLKYYPTENFNIVLYEDLRADPLNTVNGCLRFLGLNELKELDTEAKNKTVVPKSYAVKRLTRSPKLNRIPAIELVRSLEKRLNEVGGYPKLSEELRYRLLIEYSDSNARLGELFNLDTSSWNR